MPQSKEKKPPKQTFAVRLGEDEELKLDSITERTGMDRSDVIRLLIRQAKVEMVVSWREEIDK